MKILQLLLLALIVSFPATALAGEFYSFALNTNIQGILKTIEGILKSITPIVAFVAISFVVYKVWFLGNTWREVLPFLGGCFLLILVPQLLNLIGYK